MNSEEKTGITDIQWVRVLLFLLMIPTLGSAFIGSFTFTNAFGFLTIAVAIVSVSESIRQTAKKTE